MERFLHFVLTAITILTAACGVAKVTPMKLGPHMIHVNGSRQINLVCTGHGFPTIVFLQGSGESILDWKTLRYPVATQACFYDRAGLGYSDPLGNGTATATAATDDLHALLRAANIKRPVVLVGHSLGGLIATLYTDRFPADVGGLVLVDTSFATQFDYPISEEGRRIVEDDQRKYLDLMRGCLALAKAGKLSQNNSHDCFALPSGLTAAESRYLIHQYTSSAFFEARISETESFLPIQDWKSMDGDEEKTAHRNFGDIPLEVLTAGIPARNPRKPEADNRSFTSWWLRGHRALAARSRRGEQHIIPRAGHNIQDDRSDAVAAAIEKVIATLRREQR